MLRDNGTPAWPQASNRLIAGLPGKDRVKLLRACEIVQLQRDAPLCEADELLRHIYFPLTSCISLVAAIDGHDALEMGLIGNEGMLGVSLLLGVREAPLRAVVQGPGSALRMSALQLQLELACSPQLQAMLKRYLYVLMSQLSQSSGCNRFHEVEARLARWLLMTQDRTQADHFHLTHALLAGRLGVRRSAVTIAAGALQQRELIRYSRGEVRIVDRAGLEAASCACYAAIVQHYAQQFGQQKARAVATARAPLPQ